MIEASLSEIVGDIEQGMIPASVYSDDDIFELERERVFGKAWIFLAHESEVPEPGDYVHVPAGGIHGFKSESGQPASMLLHFSPGAPREGYFEGLVRVASSPSALTLAWAWRRYSRAWSRSPSLR